MSAIDGEQSYDLPHLNKTFNPNRPLAYRPDGCVNGGDGMIKNPFTAGTQKYRLLQALNFGPITTGQLLYDLKFGSHVRRMKDVRDYLHTIGYTIKKKNLGHQCFEYRIVKLELKRSPLSFIWGEIKRFFYQPQTEA